jgi:hypothetical protein
VLAASYNSAPALSGVPPDPAPHSHRQSTVASCGRSHPRQGPRRSGCGTGSAGCAGRSRARSGDRVALGGVSNTRPIVLTRFRAIEHASRYRPRRAPSDKAGAGRRWGRRSDWIFGPLSRPWRGKPRTETLNMARPDPRPSRRPLRGSCAGLDRSEGRAPYNASAPGEQPSVPPEECRSSL